MLIDKHIVRHGVVPKLSHVKIRELYDDLGCTGDAHEKYTFHKIEDAVKRRAGKFRKKPYTPHEEIVVVDEDDGGPKDSIWKYPKWMQAWLKPDWIGDDTPPAPPAAKSATLASAKSAKSITAVVASDVATSSAPVTGQNKNTSPSLPLSFLQRCDEPTPLRSNQTWTPTARAEAILGREARLPPQQGFPSANFGPDVNIDMDIDMEDAPDTSTFIQPRVGPVRLPSPPLETDALPSSNPFLTQLSDDTGVRAAAADRDRDTLLQLNPFTTRISNRADGRALVQGRDALSQVNPLSIRLPDNTGAKVIFQDRDTVPFSNPFSSLLPENNTAKATVRDWNHQQKQPKAGDIPARLTNQTRNSTNPNRDPPPSPPHTPSKSASKLDRDATHLENVYKPALETEATRLTALRTIRSRPAVPFLPPSALVSELPSSSSPPTALATTRATAFQSTRPRPRPAALLPSAPASGSLSTSPLRPSSSFAKLKLRSAAVLRIQEEVFDARIASSLSGTPVVSRESRERARINLAQALTDLAEVEAEVDSILTEGRRHYWGSDLGMVIPRISDGILSLYLRRSVCPPFV
ncbi:hypothetical protein CORC01_06618 [Colletotrichum orchidophilum]|uniref:Uncharacterized protein n=1 Tax=Colletotrichum orchidophilum TaxID=1209926 RepID=A0A1G4B9L2_9PEZI|nr:uncharacterized protein CORC01_06618 [Colletotrichum orchidophilum]OHE98104.1 hypothetical protein CORC01_06618 [Colletotrichum orchidophilum]